MIEIDKIYCENCLDTMRRMDDEMVDLTVTSPPYDDLRDYHGYSFPFEDIARELFRVTKYGGVVVWIVNDATINGSETGTSFRQALFFKEIGFNIHDTMIWKKACPIPYDPKCNRYWQSFEYMFVFSKGKPICNYITEPCVTAGKPSPRDYGQKRKDGTLRTDRYDANRKVHDTKVKDNVWVFNNNNENVGHPAMFPKTLAADHIRSWSNEGDLVYDCFLGSGTTVLAAEQLNRHYIGSEISQEYYDIAQSRLSLQVANQRLF